MKVWDVEKNLDATGEYILGSEQTGSHACYLIYGKMAPREKDRKLKAGRGHEEIFLAMRGDFVLTGTTAAQPQPLKQGQAFHLAGEETYFLENATDQEAVYLMAGGHSTEGHH